MYEFVCPAAAQRGGTIVVPHWAITSLISALERRKSRFATSRIGPELRYSK